MNKGHLCLVKFSNKHNIYLKSTLLLETYIYGGTNGSFYAKARIAALVILLQERMRTYLDTVEALPFTEEN